MSHVAPREVAMFWKRSKSSRAARLGRVEWTARILGLTLIVCALPFAGCHPQFGPAFQSVGDLPTGSAALYLWGEPDEPGAEVCVVEVASPAGGVAVEILPGGYYHFETQPGPVELFVQEPGGGAMQSGPSFELADSGAAFYRCARTPDAATMHSVDRASAEGELPSRRALPADSVQRIGAP